MRPAHPLGLFIICDDEMDRRLNVARNLQIPTAHILAPPPERRDAEHVSELKRKFGAAGVAVSVVFCGFAGESYAGIEAVRQTTGLVPLSTRNDRLTETLAISEFAAAMGVPALGMHLGFLPDDPNSLEVQELVRITQTICDTCQANGQTFHLETGQESAEALLRFLETVNRDNLAINFDPANMILYGTGEPLPALRQVAPHVKSVHCKDAVWSGQPGMTWGDEVPLGDGAVDFVEFFEILKSVDYQGPLTIEREVTGEQQAKDIETGVARLREWRQQVWRE